jgi:orotidine-5'-phosphate decarboxylase
MCGLECNGFTGENRKIVPAGGCLSEVHGTPENRLDSMKSCLCVGLDSYYDKLPCFVKKGRSVSEAIFEFNKMIVEATSELAVAYKMNVAFYAGYGEEGLAALRRTNRYLREIDSSVPIIADCKRSEMGETVKLVRREIFDWLGFDCVMVTPWFGADTFRDYLEDESKGVVVYVHDSNPSAGEIQDLVLKDGRKVYEIVAEKIAGEWNINGNLFAEAAATYPDALRKIRRIIGEDMPLLVAGVGPQGGKIEDLAGLFGLNGRRLLVNSSRGVIFSSSADYGVKYRQEVGVAARELVERLRFAAGGNVVLPHSSFVSK